MASVRITREGLTLRFGDSDTPAPEGAVAASPPPRIVVALNPVDPRARVTVLMRAEGGERTLALRAGQRTREEQFFEGSFPDLRGGDRIKYSIRIELERAGSLLRLDSAEAQDGVRSVEVTGDAPAPGGGTVGGGVVEGARRVEGRVVSVDGQPAAGVVVRLYQRGFGGNDSRLGEITTDARGAYALPYQFTGTANIELRAVDGQSKEVSLSKTRFDARELEELNVVAPPAALPRVPEFAQLRADLAKEVPDLRALGAAVENDERQDFSALNAATGWDTRLVSLAAAAEKHSSETGISSELLYAAFRAGLPMEPTQFGLVGSDAFVRAVRSARDAGVVSIDEDALEKAKTSYDGFARASRRKQVAPGTLSTYGDLLGRAGLTETEASDFEELYFTRRSGRGDLWKAAREKGLAEKAVNTLRLQGKLAALTLNNAALVDSLRGDLASPDKLGALVEQGFYEAGPWKARLTQLGANTPGGLEQIVPPTYVGDTLDARVENYAEDLARRVRQSFPTKVVAQRVASDEFVLGADHARVKGPLARVLKNAEEKGIALELGKTPIAAALRKDGAVLLEGVASEDRAPAEKSLKLLSRLYQVTPSDHALGVMLSIGIESASQVAALRLDDFLRRYGERFLPREAELVHSKCVQVSQVVFNSFIHAQQALSPSGVGVLSPSPTVQKDVEAKLRSHFPTLETLFGSLDYCECEHCQSVLSPAAYFVDLLQFLDPSEFEWGNVLSAWQSEKGTTYPYAKPYDVLTSRRPDLPHVALTCENTNTALPYIDVVNEVLEYYVGNGKLEAAAARDTGEVDSADLIAEPRFMTESAYEKLAEQVYPLSLPFDLWSETARRFLEHFDLSHAELLETFRRSEELFSTSTATQDYGRSSVFLEQLGLSPAEATPFTNAQLIQDRWWELFGYGGSGSAAPENTALAELSSAKTLSRRLGVSYKELVALVRAWFVNPELDALVTLKKVDLEILDILRLKGQPGYLAFSPEEQLAFTDKLNAAKARFGFDPAPWIDERWAAGDFKNVVVLADTTAGCDFETTILRFADGRAIDKVVLVRLNLFVRLWRKLGWRLDDLDQALRIFVPSSQPIASRRPPGTLEDLATALKSVLVYLAHLKTLDGRLAVGAGSLQKLLAFWGPICTRGSGPLYAQLFLTPSVLTNDSVFDNALGRYLSQPGQLLRDHLPALQGAVGVTAADVELVLTHAGQPLETALLSLDSVSLVLRYAVLAKGLRIPIAELLLWIRLSGVNPFEALSANALSVSEDDRPFSRTLRFLDFVEKVRDSGVTAEEAGYALLHLDEGLGPNRERADVVAGLLRELSARLERVALEHAIPTDIGTFSDEVLRQKLALASPAEVVDTFMGMWKRSPPPTGSAGSAQLPQIAFDAQRSREFLDREFPGLFAPGDEALFDPATTEADRRQRTANVLLPFIQRRESRRHVAAVVTAQLGSEEAVVDALLNDPALLADPTVPGGSTPVVESYLLAADRGLTVTYFATPDLSGPALQAPSTVSAPELQTVPAQAQSVRVEGLIEVSAPGRFRFFVKAQGVGSQVQLQLGASASPTVLGKTTSAVQELEGRVELKAGALIPFRLELRALSGGFSCSLEGPNLARGSLSRLVLRPQALLERLTRAQLLVSKVLGLANGLALSEGELRYIAGHADAFEGFAFSKLPLEASAAAAVTPAAVGQQLLALAEYVQCRRVLGVSSDEMSALLDGMERVVIAAADLGPAKEQLLLDVCEAIAKPMRRTAGSVKRLIQHFKLEVTSTATSAGAALRMSGLAKAGTLRRVLRGLEVASVIGASVETLVGPPAGGGAVGKAPWAQPIPPPAVTPNPGPEIARGIRDGVRALYDGETWRRVAQPISDKLRQRKRDALVAHVMHTGDFQSKEELFQYFVLDPGMEPVVYTSRIQLAISSVQTFIQRCFLNLEAQPPAGKPTLAVPPSALDAEHWRWLKRQTVRRANTELFLFPENLLEPEFRDDKSYLYEELESALLEGDVSDELVDTAFLKYLEGLDEIARLEIVSCSADEQRGTLHVVARTYNLTGRKYFYRKNVWGNWFPWEPVTADIQGDHVIPVMWKKRLHIFWVNFMEKGNPPNLKRADGSSGPTPEELSKQPTTGFISHGVEAQLNWVERVGDTWSARSASPQLDLAMAASARVELSKVSIHATTSGPDSGPVLIHLGGDIRKALRLASKNGVPTVIPAQAAPQLAFTTSGAGPTYRWGSGALEVKGFAARQVSEYGADVRVELQDVTILGKDDGGPAGRSGGTFELVAPAHRVLSAAVRGDETQTPLFRLYHPAVDDHFYTTSENERDFAISLGYQYEGIACEVLRANDPGSVPLYRLYSPATGDHFYTTSAPERDNARNNLGYQDEGVAAYVPTGGDTVPLYRSLNPNAGNHFYTTSLAEKENAVKKLGFTDEGVACAVFPPQIGAEELQRLTTPVFYRDSRHVFFVDPSVEETAFDKWEEWAVPVPYAEATPWKPVSIVPQKPFPKVRWPVELKLSPEAVINPVPKDDWLANGKTILVLGDRAIGAKGSLPTKELLAKSAPGAETSPVGVGAAVGLTAVGAEEVRVIGARGASAIPGRAMVGRGALRPF